jgi:hypothetical protein
MNDAENLRRQAKRALRLAGAVLDQQASEALASHAATLSERAQNLEQEGAEQQPPEQY